MDALLDYYKLSYDPDPHSYFLAKATLVYLPVVTEPFGQLRGFGTGLLAAANQQVGGQVLTEAQRARILTLLTIAARDFEDVEQTFSKVFAITPELAKGKLADEMKATGTATKQMLELARRELIETQTLSFDSSEFYKLLSQGIDQQFALADVAVSALNEEFAHELAALQTRKYVRLGIAAVFIVLATLLSIAVARNVLRVEAERETIADKVKKDNDALNDSIIEILRSVAKAAQGDLTVQAPVREDVTGALSDAINSMADSTAKTLAKVAAASHEVRSASQEGRDTVHQTARGMNDIRGTIQETGKRIKRLGERSQEITGIVKLIDDIAERTSVLALNANMQAAVAGEAGRGFRVVADEVQRLAERSKEATDQIGKLVGTIQAETNDTMSTMDRAIGEVVKGGELAEKAAAKVSHLDELGGQLLESVELFKLPEEALRQAGLGEQSARGLRKVA
jgi:methyl-accepting chemotaxis protein